MTDPSTPSSGGAEPGSAKLKGAPRSSLPAAWPAGMVLRDRYRLTGTLKRDRVATVYRAEEVETGRPVTVKIFHEVGQNDRRVQRSRRTASSHAPRPELPSAFLAVHACDLTDEGQLFLVTGVVRGRSLADLLRETPELAPTRALELATRIGEALEAALNLGHLDLPVAPADIIVDDADHVTLLRSDVLILDQLGLAEQLRAAEALDRDPRYASPEERAGLAATERSVVYRFGVLLYELLCGSAPFAGTTTSSEVRDRQLRSPPSLLRDRHPALPASVNRLVLRMLESNPTMRPADLTSILNELWGAACRLRAEPPPALIDAVSAAAPPASSTPGRRFRPKPWAFAGLLIVVIGGAFLVGPHLVRSLTAPTSVATPVAPAIVVSQPPPVVVSQPPRAPEVVTPPLGLPPSSPGPPSGLDSSRVSAPNPLTPPLPPAVHPSRTPTATSSPSPARPPNTKPIGRGVTQAGSPPVPASVIPTPPSRPDPLVAPPPARPSPTVPESLRASDPTAIIEWLVRQGPRLGDE